MSEKYRIVRFYEDEERPGGHRRIMKRGLTLEEAKEHCNDDETSSYTAQPPRGCGNDPDLISAWHQEKKHWFDGYEHDDEEEDEDDEQHTYELETTEGLVYLVLNPGDDLEEQWELYKNDEAGESVKNAELISYRKIN